MSRTGRALQDTLARKCYHPSGAFDAFPRSALDIGVPAKFEQQARLHGNRPAVESDAGRLSYAQLNGVANDIAHALIATESIEPYVAVLTDQGAMSVAAQVGVLKAGRAFVPLDPQWPEARMRWVLDHSHAPVVLSSASNASLAREIARPPQRVRVLEDLVTASGRANPGVQIDADAPAYVLYTSGSTGRPKGVRHSHRSLTHEVLRLTNALHVCADDRQTLLRANSGGAISDAFTALLNGAAVCPIDVREVGTDGLARWVTRERVTIWRSTPSLFRAVWGALPATTVLPHLRIVFLCGEPVNASDFDAWRAHGDPACLFVNCLGSTECATVTLYLSSTDAALEPGPVSLGYPVDDMEVHLVDESGDIVIGPASGEIVVRSRYLADGYVDEPELSEQSFRDDPEDAASRLYFSGDIGTRLDDGSLIYQGRKDSRANLHGRTFELAEIETALQAMDDIREAVAAVVVDARGAPHLVAYVVSNAVPAWSTAALQLWLQERVPSFMIPARFMVVDRIPLTATGKADRRALADPFFAGPAVPAVDEARLDLGAPDTVPHNPTEEQLAGIWCEVLGIHTVGARDNFFELGGHSLLALQLLDRIERTFHIHVSLREFVRAPTIAGQSVRMIDRRDTPTPCVLVELRAPLDASEAARPALLVAPGLFGYAGEWRTLFQGVAFNRAVYGLEFHDSTADATEHQTLEGMASDVVALVASQFSGTPLHLAGHSFGGLVAYELGQQLRAQAIGPLSVVLVDASADVPSGPFTSRDVVSMAANLPRWLVNELRVYGPGALWNRVTRVAARTGASTDGDLGPGLTGEDRQSLEHLKQMFDWPRVPTVYRGRVLRNYTAIMNYRPRPTENQVVYLHSRVRNLIHRHRPDGGWSQHAPIDSLNVYRIPGDHGSALHERWRPAFVATLRQALDAVDVDAEHP